MSANKVVSFDLQISHYKSKSILYRKFNLSG